MVAQRTRDVEISGIRKMFEGAPPNAINLGLGEPDFDPPKVVLDALCHAVRTGKNHYGPSAGRTDLRAKVAELYRDRDESTSVENVIITAGGSEALMSIALSLYDPGDEVLVPDPGFVLYAPHARLAGATPVPYDLAESRGFCPDLDALEALVTPRTKAIVVNSPSNPTGGVFDSALVDRLVAFADAHDLYLLSDEVYDGLVYRGRFASFWGRSDRVVVANSFSKRLAMTGWRLGFLVAPRNLAVDINKIHYHVTACPSTPAQIAALAGLEAGPSIVQPMVQEFHARRRLVVRELNRIPGLTCVPPAGAFYAFPRFDWPGTSTEVAHALLGRGLITTPGDAFGHLGASHLRLSFAASRDALQRGLSILRTYAREVAG
ncbi:MAG: aminotransferase class I/II-fold pyridoxal phosphate-dependent enzyme [Thermoplasmata archaeon]|nr:aminotransferase class I/II-fold pyridoxal phosphate-dependent enzyme [Thermoplasmata archaeon]MCI4359815.1 aminotransferase class I/II-fold pyridoxal phosphate-dependent enzyme [Thermoplasmata archaeon]